MDNVKDFILNQLVKEQISKDEAKKLLLELSSTHQHQDIAVIGLAGRFAAAASVDEFWDFLKVEKSSVRDYPQARKDDMRDVLRNPYYAELILGKAVDESIMDDIYAPSSYLERIDHFDANFFGISPLEADYMDPHQRIALEVAYEALENAGYGPSVKGTNTGVFMGRDHTNYSFYRLTSEPHPMQLTGSWEGLVGSRISYLLDLKGPCLMLDTACSAGSVGVHQAIQSLVLGECDMALAGGINLSTTGETIAEFAAGLSLDSVEAPDNTVRTFDSRASGTRWAEGAGIVILKPLDRAVADGDHIRAVIKTSAINNDGASNSITAPNALMQEKVILDAWAKGDVDPQTIGYVEAHGTGTVLGDPIEIKGLTNAFRQHTSQRQFCGIGSLKTTTGHMVGASGVASMAKVVKSLETGMLAPSANFDVPNPYINFVDSPLYVNDRLTPWDSGDGPRRAAINSFGFIRTNSHMVLEEAPQYRSEEQRRERYYFTVSAKTDAALRELLDGYATMLADSPWSLADICYTSNIGRGHYEHRVMAVATSKEQLAESIDLLRQLGLGSAPVRGIFHGVHAIVSGKKAVLDPGDITAQDAQRLAHSANAALAELRDSGDRDRIAELGDAYVRGAEIDFFSYYEDEGRRRVPLPTYPYEKTRHWAKPVKTRVEGFVGQPQENPLLGREVSRTDSSVVFENTLSIDRHWVLSDHRIDQTAVIPGTTYLEMARAAFATVENTQRMQLDNVFFLLPLSVQDGEGALVQTRLARVSGGYAFQVVSQRHAEWVTHVEGRVSSIDDVRSEPVDVEAAKRSAVQVDDPYAFEGDTGVFQFGPRWDAVRTVWHHDAGALALVRLRDGVDDETATYGLHPAKLDNAVNLISQNSGKTYLPYMYKSFVLHRHLPETFYSLIRVVRDDGVDSETITYDVDLVDEAGHLLAQISDYTVKKVDWHRFSLDGPRRFLDTRWVSSAPAEQPNSDHLDQHWAFVVADTPAGHAFVSGAEKSGRRVLPTYLGNDTTADDVDALCAHLAQEPVWGILFATDFTADADESHEHRRAIGVDALFELQRGLLEHRIKPELGLKVLVKNAWQVDAADSATDPYSAATASLALVIGQEYRHLLTDAVDASADIDTERIVSECMTGNTSTPRAVRSTGTYVRQLAYVDAAEEPEDSPYQGGTFLVTGGAGGLGLSIAEAMAQEGAERIILLGRRTLNEPTMQRVDAMRVAEYITCDISVAADIDSLAERLRADDVALTGIIHAAGIAGDGFLATKDRAQFDAVLAPKIDGSVGLLRVARHHPDAFIVFFSSITAVTGGQGQGDYCSANAFMDSLATRARSEGLRALSINWPTWSEVGMAVEYGVDSDGSLFDAIAVKDGLSWLSYFLQKSATGVIPAEFNLPAVKEEGQHLPFLLPPETADAVARIGTDAPATDSATTDVRLTGLSDPNPTQLTVGAVFATVLGLAEVDVHASFQDLGGNSLMTAQLLTLIDNAYPGTVDIADLFSYATVADLASYIDEQSASGVGNDTSASAADSADQVLEDVLDELGDAELTTMFSESDRTRNHG